MSFQFSIIPSLTNLPQFTSNVRTKFLTELGAGTYVVPAGATKLMVTLVGPVGEGSDQTVFDTITAENGAYVVCWTNEELPASFDFIVGTGGVDETDGFIIVQAFFE